MTDMIWKPISYCIFVLHLEDGRYALIECKLGSNEIEEGASHLLELKRLIREHNEKEKQMPIREPDLLIILTGGQMAYTRPDGVKIPPKRQKQCSCTDINFVFFHRERQRVGEFCSGISAK